MLEYNEIFKNNKRWIQEKTKINRDYFRSWQPDRNPLFFLLVAVIVGLQQKN